MPPAVDIATKVRQSKAVRAAVDANDTVALRVLLVDEGADPNFEINGMSPFHLAISKELFQCARVLMENGANVDVFDKPPVYAACGALPELEAALTAGANNKGETMVLAEAFSSAALKGQLAACEWLLARGADVNPQNDQVTPLLQAAKRGHLSVVKLLLQHKAFTEAKNRQDSTALHLSCFYGHEDAAHELVAAGANVHARTVGGLTPLHCAAQSGSAACVRLLLGKGADADARTTMSILSPLHYAVLNGDADAAEALLQGGADVNAVDRGGRTALMIAAHNGHGAVVKALLRHKADTKVKTTEDGKTALHHACCEGHTMIVADLLAAKASTSAKDASGDLPAQAKTDSDR